MSIFDIIEERWISHKIIESVRNSPLYVINSQKEKKYQKYSSMMKRIRNFQSILEDIMRYSELKQNKIEFN